MKIIIAVALLGATSATVAGLYRAPPTPPTLSVNWMRVLEKVDRAQLEPGVRLEVPAVVAQDVWSYLAAQHRSSPSVVQLTDWYYDTAEQRLAKQWIAVRLRWANGSRAKLQVKAYDRHTGHASEVDFDVQDGQPKDLWDTVTPDERLALTDTLALLGVQLWEVRPQRAVFQARQRVELNRDGKRTVASLDHLTWNGGEHHVLELTPRGEDDDTGRLTDELRAVFPMVHIDPTPKMVAVAQRTVAQDDICVWGAARFMCWPAPAPERAPVPSFLSPVAPAPARQSRHSGLSGLGSVPFATPFGTGMGRGSATFRGGGIRNAPVGIQLGDPRPPILRGGIGTGLGTRGGIGTLGTGGGQLGTPVY